MRYQVKGMVFNMNQKSMIIVVLTLIMMVTVYQIGKAEPQSDTAQVVVNDTAIRIRTVKAGRLQSMGSHRVGHD